MPAIASPEPSVLAATGGELANNGVVKSEVAHRIGGAAPKRRSLPVIKSQQNPVSPLSPKKWKSPRRSINASPNSPSKETVKKLHGKLTRLKDSKNESLVKKNLSPAFHAKSKWNLRDAEQVRAVKEALHVSTAPQTVLCRQDEQRRVLDFCRTCVEQEKAGSLYACGCPGTGKSLSMDKVKQLLIDWAKETGCPLPGILTINCTSLGKPTDIFSKILEKTEPRKKANGSILPLKHLQDLYSANKQSSGMNMMLLIVDEMDYLIHKHCAVLHDLFTLTTLPFSNCILIGVANSIDLADRFLPKLQSLNCKPIVVTFRAYSHDQILAILQQRLAAFPYATLQPQALELCARKVAAASGDMRKALSVCRTAVEILEAEQREFESNANSAAVDCACSIEPEMGVVRIDHMALALSRAFTTPMADNVQSLPQHQQIILCSAVKLFRGKKKDTSLGELNGSYVETCKSALIPPVGFPEFSSMCSVLADQGLLKMSQIREDKSMRVTLKVDESDITFALQGIRFFRNCLE